MSAWRTHCALLLSAVLAVVSVSSTSTGPDVSVDDEAAMTWEGDFDGDDELGLQEAVTPALRVLWVLSGALEADGACLEPMPYAPPRRPPRVS